MCGGIAEHYGIEVLIVRLIAIAGLLFLTTPTVITYVVATFVMKKRAVAPTERPAPVEAPASRTSREDSAGRRFREVRSHFDRVEQRLRRIEGHVTSESYELHRELERMARS